MRPLTKTVGEQMIEELERQHARDLLAQRLKIFALMIFIAAAIDYIYRSFQ